MSIKNMTDKGLSFPQIGIIRKGAPKEPTKPGKDLNYFRVEFSENEKKSAADFLATYKEQPRTIRIILPFNEIPRMWDAWYEAYTAGRMVARSDGEKIIYQCAHDGTVIVKDGIEVATGLPKPHPEDMFAGNDYKGNGVKFKPVGRLNVIVPELKRAAYLTLITTSIHDITNISAQLAGFSALNNGQIAGIPFYLRRTPRPVSVPKADGSRVRMIKFLCSIEADPDWVAMKLDSLKTLALPNTDLLLPASNTENLPVDEDVTDGETEEYAELESVA